MTSIAVICPDTNIELSVDTTDRVAVRGGKSAILQLAAAWARAGNAVTIFSGRVAAGSSGNLSVRAFEDTGGDYDVVVYVTGALGHFRDAPAARAKGRCRLHWINGPGRAEPAQFASIDWYVAPAQFLARRAIDEWKFPAKRVVVIRGESAPARFSAAPDGSRDAARAFFASHPSKGLEPTIEVLRRCREMGAPSVLDCFGGDFLWGYQPGLPAEAREWVRSAGDVPQAELARRMRVYGFMPYFTEWVDGFSTATAEAMAAGVVVFATAHGSNAEYIRHGWNGYLVRSVDGKPDLEQGVSLVSDYLRDPGAYARVRENAMRSVATWDEQAAEWAQLWGR